MNDALRDKLTRSWGPPFVSASDSLSDPPGDPFDARGTPGIVPIEATQQIFPNFSEKISKKKPKKTTKYLKPPTDSTSGAPISEESLKANPSPKTRAYFTPVEKKQQLELRALLQASGGPDVLLKLIRKARAEQSLHEFVRQAWPFIDPTPFKDSWHIKAVCDHLEAVTRGKIKRLIINIPPRSSKSSIVCVCWPAWIWAQSRFGPLSGPHTQMLFASYAQSLSERDSVKTRRLIESAWYQDNWGKDFSILGDQNTKRKYETSAGGYRLATSVEGTLTGEGAALIVIDDPISANDSYSETVRETTNRWWDETMSTRLNDSSTGAFVIIMQRLHDEDLTGHILTKDKFSEYVHLKLPMRLDNRYPPCVTYINDEEFFHDPRTYQGELLCPDRFNEEAVKSLERELGPFGASGQLQQNPSPRGGGIIQEDWWQYWPPLGEEKIWQKDLPDKRGIIATRIIYPPMSYVVASLDTAYTEKEENDWSACTVWGIFEDRKGEPKIMLIYAWRARLAFHDLVQKVFSTIERTNLECDAVLIENKASGHSLAQELKRLMRPGQFALHLLDPKRDGGGDKVSRMYAVQPSFAAKLIYAPTEMTWCRSVIDEVSAFPKGKYDDQADTVSQAINWLRKRGLARMPFEHEEDIRPKPFMGQSPPIYDV